MLTDLKRTALVFLVALFLVPSFAFASFDRPLSLGATGPDVSSLQNLLKDKGFYAYPEITGYFGEVTRGALAKYQASVGLEAIGQVGPKTLALLNGTMPSSALSSLITALQQLLRNAGYYEVELTGALDAPTMAAAQAVSSSVSSADAPKRSGGKPQHSADDEEEIIAPGTPDTDAPVISNIDVSPSETSVTVSWTTDEAATSQVEYGATASYTASSTLDSSLATSHSVSVSGLTASTTYHFRVLSRDSTGNLATSSDQASATWQALPSLPLATGAKVIGFGHSVIDRANFTSGNPTVTGISSYAQGVLQWVRTLDQRFDLDTFPSTNLPAWRSVAALGAMDGSNQGRSADQLTNLDGTHPGTIARTPFVLDRDPDIIYLDIGTNDIDNGLYDTAEGLIEKYDEQLELLRAGGKWVIATTIYPRSTVSWNSEKEQVREDFNAWLRSEYADERSGLVVVDADTVLGTDTDTIESQYFSDGLHPNNLGAHAIATELLLPALQNMVAPGSFYVTDPTVSNVMPDAGMLGTTGTKGAGITGTVATNYSVSRNTGTSTVAVSKEVINGSFEKQVFTITPIADANPVHRISIQKTASPSLAALGLAAGDWIQSYTYVEASAWDHWIGVTGLLTVGSTTAASFTDTIMNSSSFTAANPLPKDGFSGWWISEPFQIPAGSDTARLAPTGSLFTVRWDGAATTTAVLKISRPIIRKVTSPLPTWNVSP